MTLQSPPRFRRRSGVILIEMMLAIGVLATFMLVSTALINASLRVPREGADAQSDKARLDGALARLRADAWAAAAIDVSEDGALVIRRPDGRTALWRVRGDGTWSRHASRAAGGGLDDADAWPAIAPGVTFRAAGPALVVEFPRTQSDEGGRVRLVSQILLSGGSGGGGVDGRSGREAQ